MTRRPNQSNREDACCSCGKRMPTPDQGQHDKREKGILCVWQPNTTDPPQWICLGCIAQLERDAMRSE